jgi:hypothetical protein
MALNSSGVISLGGTTAGESVNLELGQAAGATITMNDTNLRSLFGVASGTISLSQGYGKSSYTINSTRGIFAQASLVNQLSFAIPSYLVLQIIQLLVILEGEILALGHQRC